MPKKTVCGTTDAAAILSFAENNCPLLFPTLPKSCFTYIISYTKFITCLPVIKLIVPALIFMLESNL